MPEHTSRSPRLNYGHKPYEALSDQALSVLAKAGDQNASWTLTYRTEGAILKTVRKVYQSRTVYGTFRTEADLQQEARNAVCEAIVKWDPARGKSLSAYAAMIAKNEIGERIAASGLIKVDRATLNKALKVKEVSQAFTEQHGRSPEQHELAQCTGKSPWEVSKLMSLVNCPVSVEERRAANRELTAGGERLSGYETEQPGEADASPICRLIEKDDLEQAMAGLAQLPELQRFVLVSTFGWCGQPQLTAPELKAAVGLPKVATDKLRHTAMMSLRAWLQKTA